MQLSENYFKNLEKLQEKDKKNCLLRFEFFFEVENFYKIDSWQPKKIIGLGGLMPNVWAHTETPLKYIVSALEFCLIKFDHAISPCLYFRQIRDYVNVYYRSIFSCLILYHIYNQF